MQRNIGKLHILLAAFTFLSLLAQGSIEAQQVSGRISAIHYEDDVHHIYAFAAATDGSLYVNYWDGNSWHWANQGNPGVAVTYPSAINYISDPIDGGPQLIHAFANGSNGAFYDNLWNGSYWNWSSQGLP